MLPKENRLDLKRKFPFLKKAAANFKSPFFVALYHKNQNETLNIGFVLSKKLGNAVSRQRLRRVLSESFRTNLNSFPNGWDIAVIGRSQLEAKSPSEVAPEVRKLASYLSRRHP